MTVERTTALIRMAKTVQRSVWYDAQRSALRTMEYPTLAMVLAIIDELAIYSAGDRTQGPRAGDR